MTPQLDQSNNFIGMDKIRLDGGTQPRAAIFQNVVDDYAELIADGAVFPPIVVFYDGNDYWPGDGFHRYHAHKKLGLVEISADIRQGTRRDAVLYSVGANASHGLRRTNEDKRRAVLTLLHDEAWLAEGIRWMARKAAVSEGMVHKLYHEQVSVHGEQIEKPSTRLVERNGKTYEQNTANIGKSAQPEIRPSSEPAPWVMDDDATPQQSPDNDNAPSSRLASFSGDNEWYTPERYIELARSVMGAIDVDPASNEYAQRTVRAGTFYSAEINGLDKPWMGKVWMNPPYSNPEIQNFVSKVIAEYQAGNATEAIVLTNNAGDTGWHHALCDAAECWCITRGRIRFESPTRESGAGAMGQSFFYFGPNKDKFKQVFSEIGRVDIAL